MTDARITEFNCLLTAVTEELDITEAQYEQARQHYEAVGGWLDQEDSCLHRYRPRIYAQGSIVLGTVVKPIGKDEFDIDLVCQLAMASDEHTPGAVYEMVGKRLRENKRYEGKISPKNRCWRLDYAEPFHMDIIPAVPDGLRGVPDLLVPDRELASWKETNPQGYREWFADRARPYLVQHPDLLREAGIRIRAEVAPLTGVLHRVKTPLQRSIQLLKRQRDIRFEGDKEKPISIVVTTLAAKAYAGQDSLFDALAEIVRGMPAQLDRETDGYPACYNPVNGDENFGDKWRKHPRRLTKMLKWLEELQTVLGELPYLSGGLPDIGERMKALYGERPVAAALGRMAAAVQHERDQSRLRMAVGTGILGTDGIAVTRNTFYGDP